MALDDRLSDLLVDWEQSQRDGREATPEELCKDAPDLLPVVRESIDSLKATRWMFAPDPSEPSGGHDPSASRAALHDTELPASHLTVEQFAASIFQSGLLSADEIAELNRRLAASDLPGEAREIASRLVTEGKLTRYQASVLLKASKDPLLVDNYVILDTLDTGGMGLVFKALHRSMNRVVALKLLPAAMMSAHDTVKRFQREVQAAASLSHPNIVAAYDADESAEIAYLVLEYVEGANLFRLVKEQGPLPVARACNYVRQAATGLAYLHSRGIIHRDVKPANLILANDGTVKLLDMGLVRFASSEDLSSVETDQELTQAGIVIGTVAYMSPEQALDTRSADQRSDIYSLGCTLFFLLTGRSLYHEETGMKTLLAHREQAVPSIRGFCEEAPVSLDAVFRTMVAKRPADRLQSMTEVVAALDACVPGLALNSPAAIVPRPVPRANLTRASLARRWNRWRSSPLRIGLAIALLASLAGGTYLAGILIRIKTKHGTTEIHVDDADAEVTVTHAGTQPADSQSLSNGRKRTATFKAETKAAVSPVPREERELARREAEIQKLQVENQILRSEADAARARGLGGAPAGPSPGARSEDPFSPRPSYGASPEHGGHIFSVDRQVANWVSNFPSAFVCLQDNPTKAVQPIEGFRAEKAAIAAIFIDQRSETPNRYHDADVERLASLHDLKWLSLRGPNVTDGLVVRLKTLKGLEGLSLARAKITDDCLPALAELRHLSYLDLSDCSGITDAGLQQLAKLKSLNDRALAASSSEVKRAWLLLGGEFTPGPLPKLGLDGTATTAAGLVQLQQALPACAIYARHILPGFKVPLPPQPGSSDRAWAEWLFRNVARSTIYIDLDPDRAIYAAKDLPPMNFQIEWIQFGANEDLGPVLNGFLLRRLGDLAHLRALEIDRKVADRDLGGLAAIKSLKSLELGSGSDEALRQVAAITGLTSLKVGGSEITDEGVKSLASLKNLRQLVLDGHAHNLNGRGFAALSGIASLRELDVRGAGIDETGVRSIAQLAGLEELDLSETWIDGKGLAELARLKHLKWLTLRYCRRLRSADLAPLVELPALENLSLNDCRINDEAVETLKKLTKLKTLKLERTGVSAAAISNLQRNLPHTAITPTAQPGTS